VPDTSEHGGAPEEESAGSPQTAAVLEKEPPRPPRRTTVGEKKGCLGCLGVIVAAGAALGLMVRLR
jgi:hypothetical protein